MLHLPSSNSSETGNPLNSSISSHVYQNRRHTNPVIKDLCKSHVGVKAFSNWIGNPLSQVKNIMA